MSLYEMPDIHKVPATLEILVENTGRVNYGPDILFNRKGITSQVLWGNEKLTGWSITPLPLYKEEVSSLSFGQEIKGVVPYRPTNQPLKYTPDCLPYKKKAFRCKNDAECA